MNAIRFVKTNSVDFLSLNPKHGEIVYLIDTNQLYTYGSMDTWIRLSDMQQNDSKKPHPRTCEGCGAVLTSNKCEYCGSEYF